MVALVLGTALFFVARTAWRIYATKLTLSFDDQTYHPSDTVKVQVLIVARRPVSWDRIYLRLVCRDRKQEGTTEPVWSEEIELTGPGRLGAGARTAFRTDLLLPGHVERRGQTIDIPGDQPLGPLGDFLSERRARDFSWSVHVHVENAPVTSISRRLTFDLTP